MKLGIRNPRKGGKNGELAVWPNKSKTKTSIIGTYPLVHSWWNLGTVTITQYRLNKSKQHTHDSVRQFFWIGFR